MYCHRKQAHKIKDLNSRIAFERVTDRYNDQRTHGGMHGRRRNLKVAALGRVDLNQKAYRIH